MQPKQLSASPAGAPVTAYLAIFTAIISASSAAILIRLALQESMPPALIAGARLFIAVLALTPIALNRYRGHLKRLERQELLWATASGIFLAIHFITWVSSLQHTTVLVSVVIVSSGPIWVALLEVIFLRIRLSPAVIVGLLIALGGGILIGLPFSAPEAESMQAGNAALNGAVLAWIGALTVSAYMLIGRRLRAKLPVIPYIWLVYGIAMLAMLAVVLWTETPVLGFRLEGYLVLLVMGLVPQLLGHSSLNYILEYFPATLVSMFSQLEPVGSAVFAFILFRELPPGQQIIGSGIIIAGVLLASRGDIRSSDHQEDNSSPA